MKLLPNDTGENGVCNGNAEFAGVDNAGVVKSVIWVIIIGYFNKRFMDLKDFNGLFVAALMGNLKLTRRPTYNDCIQSTRFGCVYTAAGGSLRKILTE